MGLLPWKEGGDERVHNRLSDAVADREQEHAPEQALKGQRLPAAGEGGPCCKGERGGNEVHDERGEHQPPEANPVGDQAREQDDDPESCQAASRDRPQFGLGKSILRSPLTLGEDAAADREAHAGGEDCHEARPQEAMRVENDSRPCGDASGKKRQGKVDQFPRSPELTIGVPPRGFGTWRDYSNPRSLEEWRVFLPPASSSAC